MYWCRPRFLSPTHLECPWALGCVSRRGHTSLRLTSHLPSCRNYPRFSRINNPPHCGEARPLTSDLGINPGDLEGEGGGGGGGCCCPLFSTWEGLCFPWERADWCRTRWAHGLTWNIWACPAVFFFRTGQSVTRVHLWSALRTLTSTPGHYDTSVLPKIHGR